MILFVVLHTFKKIPIYSLQKWWRRRKKFHCNDDVSAVVVVKSNPKTEICRLGSVEPCKKNHKILFLVLVFLTVLIFCKNDGGAGKFFYEFILCKNGGCAGNIFIYNTGLH
jgi:hypothetical protein